LKNPKDNNRQPFVIEVIYEDRESKSFHYAREKLGGAVRELATGVEEIKVRLANAFIELAILQESDFPAELVELYKSIHHELTRGKMQYYPAIKDGELVKVPSGKLYSTLRYMRKAKAQEIARQILELKERLDKYTEG